MYSIPYFLHKVIHNFLTQILNRNRFCLILGKKTPFIFRNKKGETAKFILGGKFFSVPPNIGAVSRFLSIWTTCVIPFSAIAFE